MSLDISPDGRTIVFDLLGDLYKVPITGGKATQVTFGLAINRQPRMSPDGRYLAFVSDRGGSENVWIADQDGRHARQLSRLRGWSSFGAVTSPTWSPDGRLIVVAQRLGASRPGEDLNGWRWLLAGYEVATARMRWISDTSDARARSTLGPAFGPQGRAVYAAVDVHSEEPWKEPPAWRIAQVDISSGRIEPEMGANMGRAGMRPAVSPNGRYLAYATSSGTHVGFRVRDLSTDRERWVLREVLDDPPLGRQESRDLLPGYAFTPDSKSLIAAWGGKIHRLDLETGRTYVVPFAADIERELRPLTIHQFGLSDEPRRTRSVLQPALSPDGNWIAFSALDHAWIMQLPRDDRHPAGLPRRLTADSGVGEFYPSWSPDGRWVVYSAWADGRGGVVRRALVAPEKSASPLASEVLTSDTAVYFDTAVTPDGERVVAVRAPLSPERLLASQLDPHQPVLELVSFPATSGKPRVITSLTAVQSGIRYPVDQLYFTASPCRVYVGMASWRSQSPIAPSQLILTEPDNAGGRRGEPADLGGVIGPDERRAFVVRKSALFELSLPSRRGGRNEADTLRLDQAQRRPFQASEGAAHRWGTAVAPWISWSRNGQRVAFAQGGSLFIGDVAPGRWTAFRQVDVPISVSPDVPRGTLVLHGARIITMRGHEVIERGDVVVRDNRIVAVGRAGLVELPAGARELDVSGTTILPGYVDIHDHLFPPSGVHAQQYWRYLAWLASGVTTTRDPAPGFDNEIFTYQERERSGTLLAPRLFSTGVPYLGADPPIRTLDDARDAVRPNAEYFRSETFKVYYDHATDRRARQLLSWAAAKQGVNATTHTNGIELALASVIDGFSGIEHAPDVPIYDDVATLIARSGTTYTQTYGTSIPGSSTYLRRRKGWPWDQAKMRHFVPPSLQRSVCRTCTGAELAVFSAVELGNLLPLLRGAAKIATKGGRVGMGAENDVSTLDIHYEMWLHALGGMPNHDVLRSATIVGAEAIGHAKDLGSLEGGKLADLQVLNANPLVDIHNTTAIRYVMKNGRLYEADDLTEIWPRHAALAAPYLWHTASPRDSSTAQQPGLGRGRPRDGRGSVPGRSLGQCDGLRSGRCRRGTT